MANPLEDYMQDLISQHKLKDDIAESDYDSFITQAQADEANAIVEVDQQPFRIAARSYNMNPDEWVGREAEGRERIKRAISANYLNQRAGTLVNKAQGKKAATTDLMGTLTRLHSVNQRGLTSLEQFAPKDPALRSELVFDPNTNSVAQQAKNLPDEDAVRAQELADYLRIPKHVAARQLATERRELNDLAWKQSQRQSTVMKNMAVADRLESKTLLDAEKAQWSRKLQQLEAVNKFSRTSKAMINQTLVDPGAPPDMKVAALMGDAMRQSTVHARREKDKAKRERILTSIATSILQNNEEYQSQAAAGNVDPELFTLAKQSAMQQMDALGVDTTTFDEEQYRDDFSPVEMRRLLTLDQQREASMQDLLSAISERGKSERERQDRAEQEELTAALTKNAELKGGQRYGRQYGR